MRRTSACALPPHLPPTPPSLARIWRCLFPIVYIAYVCDSPYPLLPPCRCGRYPRHWKGWTAGCAHIRTAFLPPSTPDAPPHIDRLVPRPRASARASPPVPYARLAMHHARHDRVHALPPTVPHKLIHTRTLLIHSFIAPFAPAAGILHPPSQTLVQACVSRAPSSGAGAPPSACPAGSRPLFRHLPHSRSHTAPMPSAGRGGWHPVLTALNSTRRTPFAGVPLLREGPSLPSPPR